MPVIFGETPKVRPLLATPPTVTITAPVVAPAGTVTPMLVVFQLVGEAGTPLKVTVLVPCVFPKPEPLMVTEAPIGPAAGDRLLRPGKTVNTTPLLAAPFTVTTMGPVVALVGTVALMLVSLQDEGVTAKPLNLTVLEP